MFSTKKTVVGSGKNVEVGLESSMLSFFPTFRFLDKCSGISRSTAVRLLQRWARRRCLGCSQEEDTTSPPQVIEGNEPANERKNARTTDAGATLREIQNLLGTGPQEFMQRRDATNAVDSENGDISKLEGEGPQDGVLDRKNARITDAGETLDAIKTLLSGYGIGPEEFMQRRDATNAVDSENADISELEGEGPQDGVLDRKNARITDAGETLSSIQKLLGAGPQEFMQRRDGLQEESVDVSNMSGEGPQDGVLDRKNARVTDAGETLSSIQKLLGAGPQEFMQRRDGLQEESVDISNMKGEGPVETLDRRDARVTDGGRTLEVLKGAEGEGPREEEMCTPRGRLRDARMLDEEINRNTTTGM